MDYGDHVSTAVDPGSRNSKCILIIDDDSFARMVLRFLFESEGYVCREAENGALGLGMFEQHQPDLIITDNNMPVLSGLEFLNRVVKKNHRKVPAVIVVTGNPSQEVKTQALQSGARAVLEKPFNLGEIRALANWLLNSEQAIHLGPPLAKQYA
ncbi:MAG: response regulator [Nitrospirales bacterium]